MFTKKIKDGIDCIGVLNPSLRIFDIVMETKYGTSYNSYLIKGSEKTAIIDVCHAAFFDRYTENIEEQKISPADIDYIVLNHNEPDHTGALAELLDVCGDVTVVTSPAGALYIKNIVNREDINIKIVKDGDELSLGDRTLKFINAPFLHWPDTMFTYVPEQKVLFSCDFLGTHYCEPYVLDSRITYEDKFKTAVKDYYDAIFSPFAPHVLAGLAKIKDLEIDTVCPSHGPVLTAGNMLEYVKQFYLEQSTPAPAAGTKKAGIFYVSAYGNTELLARTLKKAIDETNPNIETELYDIVGEDPGKYAARLNECDMLLIGTPTINKDALPNIWQLLSHIDAINSKGKPALVFGSYGWSGEAVPMIKARLEGLKYSFPVDCVRAKFVPSEQELDAAYTAGAEFAAVVK